MSDAEAIWEAIDRANAAWRAGHTADVARLFAEDAVLVAPGLRGRVEGRSAIVQTYVDYVASVRTHAFEVQERALDVFGGTAVAAYRFAVRYELGGTAYDEVGEEVLVLKRGEEGWQAVWRTQIMLPPG